MKTVSLLFIAALTSCAASPNIQQTQPLYEGFNTPPNTTELLVSNDRETQEREAAITEEKLYWQSVENITNTIREQALNIAICAEEATDKNDCIAIKSRYCQVDMLIDSRGGHHNKPFCKDQ